MSVHNRIQDWERPRLKERLNALIGKCLASFSFGSPIVVLDLVVCNLLQYFLHRDEDAGNRSYYFRGRGWLSRVMARRSMMRDPRRREDGIKVCHMLLLGKARRDFRIWKEEHQVGGSRSSGACLEPRDAW